MSARDVVRLIAVDIIGVCLAIFGGTLLWLDFHDGTPSTVGAIVGGSLMLGGGVLIDPERVAAVVAAVKANLPSVKIGGPDA